VPVDVIVRDADNPPTLLPQEFVAPAIIFHHVIVEVLTTVDFNNQFLRDTCKVRDEWSDRVLATKGKPGKRLALKPRPKNVSASVIFRRNSLTKGRARYWLSRMWLPPPARRFRGEPPPP